jgi:hypothetical protein
MQKKLSGKKAVDDYGKYGEPYMDGLPAYLCEASL